ncbi:MAG: TVP38/TMEM64 family protein [Clostridiales bacterium]|nr:TVP38/TMEM64 family protein [Clostridiales bacterium]
MKMLFYFTNFIIIILSVYILFFVEFNINFYLKLTFLIVIFASFLLSYVFKLFKKRKLSRLFYVIYAITFVLMCGYYLLYRYSILTIFSSVQSFKDFILSTKEKGIITYILIQAGQVVILPIPAAIICVVGSLIYGPFLGGVYCSIGVLIGSYISFFIGKTFGYRLVSWIVGKENTDKYSQIIVKRGSFFLVLAFLLPMFPDDILCLIAGITNINYRTFFLIALITRPIGVICMSYFGSGKLIPFTGWGIYAWIGILIVAVILVYVTYKYQEKMQNIIINKIFKKNLKN